MKRRCYRCVHCGAVCGPGGHVRVATRLHPACPHVAPLQVVVTTPGETPDLPRVFGFCCPVGHVCRFGVAAGLVTMKRPEGAWRNDPPTFRQLAFLITLQYDGPQPRTKGEARDLLQRITDGELVVAGRDVPPRAIRLRDEPKGDRDESPPTGRAGVSGDGVREPAPRTDRPRAARADRGRSGPRAVPAARRGPDGAARGG